MIAPYELLRALREICHQHGIVLIADEIQTGFARTGKMFGIQNSGVEPDMITVAKSLAGGFPLSGVVGRADLMDSAESGGLGGTYAGNPVACAAALAVLDVIDEERLVERSNQIGAKLKAALAEMERRNDTLPISEIRGLGAMVGFDIVRHRGANEPDAERLRGRRRGDAHGSASDPDLASIRLRHAIDQAQQCRLAGAVSRRRARVLRPIVRQTTPGRAPGSSRSACSLRSVRAAASSRRRPGLLLVGRRDILDFE